MNHFIFNKYKVNLIAEEDGFISDFASSMIRGSLFNSLRAIVCLTKSENCRDCIVWDQCAYSYFFELPERRGKDVLNLGDSAPHPYIIEMPYPHRHFIKKQSRVSFNVILIGKSIIFLPHLVCAIIRMCERGIGRNRLKVALESVELHKLLGQMVVVYDNSKLIEHPIVYRSRNFFDNIEEVDKLILYFETPLRIKHKGRLCKDLNFEILIKNILRRITLISMFYGEGSGEEEINLDVHGLLERAKDIKMSLCRMSWVDLGRYSSAQKTDMQLGGIKGRVVFEGALTEFMPYIRLCEHLHVGKNTSFGLGKYVIE